MHRILLTISFFLIIGCAMTPYEQGRDFLRNEQYDAAIQTFEAVLQETPDSGQTLRDVGIAYYKKGDYPQALNYLNRAFEQMPEDGGTILYLGLVHERQGNYDDAIQAYRNYTQVGRLSRTRKKIETRLRILINQRMTQLAKEALTAEAEGNYPEIQTNTVAVMYFDNIANSEELEPLRKGLTDLVITDLSKVSALKVVERARLQKLLEEMELAETGVIDESTIPRTGRLLGAAKVVKGSFTALADENLLINVSFSETSTAEIKVVDSRQGRLQEIFDMEKALVFRVLDEMKIPYSPEEEEAIQKRPTENLLAFLAYSRGLDGVDKANYDAAIEAFQEAVELDPGFTEAQDYVTEVQEITAAPTIAAPDLDVAEAEIEAVAADEVQVFVAPPAEVEALAGIDAKVSKGFIQQPKSASTASTAEGEDTARGGGSDQAEIDPLTGRTVPITIIWEP